MEFLVQRVDGILHEDGGHKSRMPNNHMKVMRNLIEIRNTGLASQLMQLAWLDSTIAKMAAICRMWRHADGQFARFNGAGQKFGYHRRNALTCRAKRQTATTGT